MAEIFAAEYRQGYLNGYQQAFEDFVRLMNLKEYSLEEAKKTCRAFWTDQLSDWLENDGDLPVLHIPAEAEQEVTVTVEPDSAPHDPYQDKTA